MSEDSHLGCPECEAPLPINADEAVETVTCESCGAMYQVTNQGTGNHVDSVIETQIAEPRIEPEV